MKSDGNNGNGQAHSPQRRPPVVLIHGLSVPRIVMWRLHRLLEGTYGRKCYNFPYNSRFADIPQAAYRLSEYLSEFKIREFDAVTHSMGGIVLRWALNHQPMPRCRRAVLLAPPNQGSSMAKFLLDRFPRSMYLVNGEALRQLRCDDQGICSQAGGLPGVEFGIIAGGSGTQNGLREWARLPIEGDHDGLVAVDETILPGMKDFMLLRETHSSMLIKKQTAQMVNLFLEYGVFRPKLAGLLKSQDHSSEMGKSKAADAMPGTGEQVAATG